MVVWNNATNCWKNSLNNLLPKSKNMNLESISSENLDKETAYLLGVYLTDGSISNSVSTFKNSKKLYKHSAFQLSAIDKDFVEFTLSCIKKIIPSCTSKVNEEKKKDRHWPDGRISKCQKQYRINVGFTKYKDFFIEQTGNKHHIPFVIWNAPLQIKKWFIAGIMDGDGWISKTKRPIGDKYQYRIGIGGVKDGWIYEFEKLLHQLNVKTCKKELLKKDRLTPFVRFSIKTIDFKNKGLFFTIKRKQNRLLEYRETFRDLTLQIPRD